MIFIDRNNVAAPAILTTPGCKGHDERDRAVTNFTSARPHAKFKFEVYKDASVKEALKILFNKKCAYCESNFLAAYPGDVEHFRPKGKITEALAPIDPGYYWLGSEWDNLLLSCKNCNSHMHQEVPGEVEEIVLGKMNQFPLHNFMHVRDHNVGIATEEPHRLLIDPCKDNPELLLSYGEDGNILAKVRIPGLRRSKAEKSIEVYALQRIDLVDERKKLRTAIKLLQQRVINHTRNFLRFVDIDPGYAAELEAQAKTEVIALKAFMDPKSVYSAMAKEMISKFLREEYDLVLTKVV